MKTYQPDGDLYQMDIISSFDQSNEQITATLKYSCVYIDHCAKNYTEERFKMLLDHQTIDCMNGLCRNLTIHTVLYHNYPPEDPFQNKTGLMNTTTHGMQVEFRIFDR
jgi:hypothetical protein